MYQFGRNHSAQCGRGALTPLHSEGGCVHPPGTQPSNLIYHRDKIPAHASGPAQKKAHLCRCAS